MKFEFHDLAKLIMSSLEKALSEIAVNIYGIYLFHPMNYTKYEAAYSSENEGGCN